MAKMLKAAIVSALASSASAGVAQECEKGLMQLQAHDDMELKMKCRAAFAPEVCKEAGRSLGAQPWSNARMEASCAQFSTIYSGSERSLESAVANKPPPPQATPDATAVAKVPPPPFPPHQTQHKNPFFPGFPGAKQEKPKGPLAQVVANLKKGQESSKPQGPVAELLKRLHESKEKEAAKKAGPVGPVAQLFSKLTKAKEAEAQKAEKKGPLANLLSKFPPPPKKSTEGQEEKQGPLAHFLKNLPHKKPNDPAAAKDAGAPTFVKLYGEEESLPKPTSSSGMHFLSGFAAATCLAAVTTLVVRRRESASATHELIVEQ